MESGVKKYEKFKCVYVYAGGRLYNIVAAGFKTEKKKNYK